jgi:hypothetical protein
MTVIIHVIERTDSKPEGRLFDGWIENGSNLETQLVAQSSRNTIAWCCRVEKAAFIRGYDCSRSMDLRF